MAPNTWPIVGQILDLIRRLAENRACPKLLQVFSFHLSFYCWLQVGSVIKDVCLRGERFQLQQSFVWKEAAQQFALSTIKSCRERAKPAHRRHLQLVLFANGNPRKCDIRTTVLSSTWGRFYDHNFLRFLPIFGEKIGVFLRIQCYDQKFE
jgi:hypothetical protein